MNEFNNRPQSAKNGQRGVLVQSHSDEISEQENIHEIQAYNRKKVKLLKPDFTTNDFTRILPKKIYQDKERLYS